MQSIAIGEAFAALDAAIEELPNRPAIFVLRPREGIPHLAKTKVLRRRLQRLLRIADLRRSLAGIDYCLTGSALESAFELHKVARGYFPTNYRETLRLRLPPYLKVVLGNPFPRTHVTTHLAGARASYYGPFRSRASAEQFESELLDLFQVRRCQEDLLPSPLHPGCMYGEMGKCLRPCQEAVGPDEYAHEVSRLVDFVSSDGRSLLGSLSAARERLSAEMQFEEAARQHKQMERVEAVLKLRDEMSRNVERLNAVAVTASVESDAAELHCFRGGCYQGAERVSFELVEGKPVSLDQKLRETFSVWATPKPTEPREREEHLAILARWFYSSWCDGEMLLIDDFDHVPYRKLVHAISRVCQPGH